MSTAFHSIGFLGAGNMAEAMIHGILRGEILPPAKITVCDKRPDRIHHLTSEYQIGSTDDPLALIAATDTVVLATKPQDVPDLLESLQAAAVSGRRPPRGHRVRVITICAGVATATVERGFAPVLGVEAPPVVRIMPNLPALIGEGAAAVAGGAHASREDVAVAMAIMDAVGLAIELPEHHLNAVTALSGSGPAYVFALVEEMVHAGEAIGLPHDAARRLAMQTVCGAALMARTSPESPAELRRRVTSKGGTTEAALDVFNRYGFAEMIREAVRAADARAHDLGF